MDKNMKTIIGIIIAVAIIAIGYGIYKKSNQPVPAEPAATEPVSEEVIKIGVILPLTGNAAVYGLSAKEGIDLALEETNNSGGINGKIIKIVYEDSQCDSTKAVNAAQKLININKAEIIIGHICSNAAMAVAPITEEKKVILFSPGASAPELTNAGEYIFRNRQSISGEASKVAEIVYKNFGIHTAAIMYANNDYGISAKDIFQKYFEKMGGNVLLTEGYEQDSNDFRTQLTKIKQLNPEAIFLAGYIKESALIVKQASELNIKTQFCSTMGVEGQDLLEIAGDAAEGIIYTAPYFDVNSKSRIVEEFVSKYKIKYGEDPAYVFAANGYDALNILKLTMEKCDTNTECIKSELHKIENYPGVSGATTFDENGDVIKPVMIKIVKDGKFVLYEE